MVFGEADVGPALSGSGACLGGGDVLLLGGSSVAERYDPAADVWTSAGSTIGQYWDPASVLLPNGRVVVAGVDLNVNNRTEIYDPVANTWSLGAKAPGVAKFNAVMLPNGLALFAPMSGKGGLYNYKTDSWSLTLPMNAGHDNVPFVPLPSGRVLMAGGNGANQSLNGAEVYDVKANAWLAAASLGTKRSSYQAAVLPDGTVIAVGGREGDFMYLTSTEIYDEKTDKWSAGPSMAVKRSSHAVVSLGGSKLLAVGGWNNGAGALASAELFAPGNPLGATCSNASECASGFCADGVCCDTKCGGGQCVVCTQAKGSWKDGYCVKTSFAPCDDGDKCTLDDKCSQGVCQSGWPKMCKPIDDCHYAGFCDAKTGECSNPLGLDGSSCEDGDLCTFEDRCKSGLCVGEPVTCTDSPCFLPGACIPSSGKCSEPVAAADGAACDDENPCTIEDHCSAGVCTSGQARQCPAPDDCHRGVCVPIVGCSTELEADGAPCEDGNPCTTGDRCLAGKCTGVATQVCGPLPDPVILNGRGGGACSLARSRHPGGGWTALIALALLRRRRNVPEHPAHPGHRPSHKTAQPPHRARLTSDSGMLGYVRAEHEHSPAVGCARSPRSRGSGAEEEP